MKTTAAILASLVAGTSAFAPAARTATSSTQLQAFEDDYGAMLPLGFFDPLGLVADGDQAKFDRLRHTELKHGRIAMLAIVGYLSGVAGNHFPGYLADGLKFEDVPPGIAGLETVPYGGKAQIFIFIGLLEVFFMRDVTGTGEFLGDYRNGFIDFGWDTFDDETKLRKRTIELNNGRAAMMGILALMVHEQMGVNILPGGFSSEYDF